MKEIFKKIPDYPHTLVGSQGTILSESFIDKAGVRRKERILKKFDHNGYDRVRVQDKEGKQKIKGVHQLVALAFVPNPENKPEVNHINEDKKKNDYKNLEWVDRKENCNHGSRNKRIGLKIKERDSIRVRCIETNEIYPSGHEAQRQTGIGHIHDVCGGKRQTAGGFHWEYVN